MTSQTVFCYICNGSFGNFLSSFRMTNMIAILGGYLNTYQLIALVALIALLVVWMVMRKRG